MLSFYQRLTTAVYSWLEQPQSAKRIGLWRIIFGSVAVVSELLLLPNLFTYFADSGILTGAWGGASWLVSPLDYFCPAWLILLLYAILLLATLTFTVGWYSQISAAVVFIILFMFELHMPLLNYGGTRIQRDAFLWAIFLPSDRALSLPLPGQILRPHSDTIGHWSIRLIQIQIALVYLFTAMQKLLLSHQWRDGSYLYALLQNPDVAIWQVPHIQLLWFPLLFATLAALSLELLFALLVWFRRLNVWVVVAMMGIHVGIALTVNAVLFSPIMIALLILCFRDDSLQDARRLVQQLRS